MRNNIKIFLIIFLFLMQSIPVFATKNIDVRIDGELVDFDFYKSYPYINSDSKIMVPARIIAEDMLLKVNWDEQSNIVHFSYDYIGGIDGTQRTVSFIVESNKYIISDEIYENQEMTVAKKTYTMNTKTVKKRGRVYIPIRYLAEAFGYNVQWDKNKSTVFLSNFDSSNIIPVYTDFKNNVVNKMKVGDFGYVKMTGMDDYQWMVDVKDTRVMSQKWIIPNPNEKFDNKQVYTWKFIALKKGEVTITFKYCRPWDNEYLIPPKNIIIYKIIIK